MLHSSLSSNLSSSLSCERSGLLGSSETESAGGRPRNGVALSIGYGDHGVVEGRADMHLALLDIFPLSAAGRDKRIEIGLTYVFGIGRTSAKRILEETGINPDTRVRDLSDEEEARIRECIDKEFIVEGDLRRQTALDIKRQRSILSVSMWVMVQSFVSLSTWFIFFVYIEHLGEESLAIANLARNISGLPFMMVIAFASAASSIVSNMIGAGQTDNVALAIRRHIWLAYLCVVSAVHAHITSTRMM